MSYYFTDPVYETSNYKSGNGEAYMGSILKTGGIKKCSEWQEDILKRIKKEVILFFK